MKNLYAVAVAMGLGILGIAASRALLPQAPPAPAVAPVNVTQHHNNPSRDGLFIDPAFTPAAAANLARDVNFDGTIVGNVYAQPLYVEGGPFNRAKVIVATESNNVYALDAITGTIRWQVNVGTPSPGMGLISTVGITGTPVIDLASRSLILVAVISGPNNMIYSLNVDTGAINPGFPIDVNASFPDFSSSLEMQRGALMLLGDMVYIPYGGYADIGNYHGRVLGVSLDGSQLGSWATTSLKSGIWNPGGIASDGTSLFVVTGNAPNGTTPWGGSEAVIRLQPGPVFSGSTTDFWVPTNWQSLDSGDVDLGGSNAIILDVPGATPSALVLAIGKDRNGYLLDRNNLGGIGAPVAQAVVSAGQVINSAATYRTSQGTYVVLRPPNGTLTTFKIMPTSPPTIATGWTVPSTGRTSPFVTSTDGISDPIVWAYGHGTTPQRLFGYNGETGEVIFNGGGPNDTITGTRTFNTGIAARGRIYIAGDNKVYAFAVPTSSTPTPSPTTTPAPTATPTATPIVTPTPPATPTPPVTTPTPTPPATPSPTATHTPTPTPPATPTPPTTTPTPTPVGTPSPTPTAAPSSTPVATPTPAAQALNLSTRMKILTGANVGIGGFIITGTGPKHLLLRAIGPSLTGSGVPNALADPVLELHGPGAFVTVTSDNWRDDPAQETLIIASGIAPTNDLESAIDAILNPGTYTAIVSGKDNTTGVGLVEVYDLSPAAPAKLANISTRAFVGSGSDVVIAGFILGGNNGNDRIAVRGIGPSLTAAGVPDALADPILELRNGNGVLLASNNDWQDNPVQASELIAAGLAPTNDLESGIATTLPPGTYTALLAGLNDGTGVGLVEVYDRGAP
jgi:outer membrane protein assembly factor BamB